MKLIFTASLYRTNVRTLSQKNRVYKCTTNLLYALNIYICTYVKDERCTENKSSKLTQTNMYLHRQRDNAANKCPRKCRKTSHTKSTRSFELSYRSFFSSFPFLYAESNVMHMIDYINRETKRNGRRSKKITETSSAIRFDKSKLHRENV